jgi:phosphonate metabolism protein (transferase hexapeptide repeat family)
VTALATKLSEAPLVHPTAVVEASTLGRYTEVAERTGIRHSTFGDYSYIMADGDILNSVVGKFCSFASDVRLNPPNHPMHRVSQHHFTYRAGDYFADAENDPSIFAWRQARPVRVGHDVWIGHGATLMPGVTVGTGAAIGAGSVVTKDVPPYAVVAGVPARLIRMRFPDDVVVRLLALAWWDWSHERLREALGDFQALEVTAFLDRHEGR